MEVMFAKVRNQFNEINNKPISTEQKNIKAREVASKEWKMIINEIPLGGEDGKGLIIYPSYENKQHLLNFLAEAHPHMEAFLHKHLKNGPIKCRFTIVVKLTIDEIDMANDRTLGTGVNTYADIFELSGFIHELHGLYQQCIIEYCTTNEGYEFDRVVSFDIMML